MIWPRFAEIRLVRVATLLCLVVSVLLTAERALSAQALAYPLFDRYLESLRQQAGIPGLSAAIVQGRRIVWETGLGQRDLEASLPALPDTPYPIGDLTQTFAPVLIGQCVDRGLDIDGPVARWLPGVDPAATIRRVLSHTSSGDPRGFRYEPNRYAWLTAVAEGCGDGSYRQLLAEEIFDRLGMADSIPAVDLTEPGVAATYRMSSSAAARYAAVGSRLAAPYRVTRGKASRAEIADRGLTAAGGAVSTVRDLARYDAALDDGVLLRRPLLGLAWQNSTTLSGASLPTGLGWFVQTYNGERVIWHFGSIPNVSSALLLKVPGRDLTLILLANSDGLSSTFALEQGDVTASLFARTFLRLFL